MASAYKSTLNENDSSDSDDLPYEIDSHKISASNKLNKKSSGTSEELRQNGVNALADMPVEFRNRILMLTSRGVSYRHRHLMNDLHSLLPHTYKDTKLDTKSSNNYNAALNLLADLHSCNYVFFLEARKHGQDLYLWLARAPNGPTVKFSVTNVHTMAELGFEGNCLKGGRGLVVFDKSFEQIVAGNEHKSLLREMLRGVFCVPSRGIRGMKPFIDRIIGIYGLDGKIWIRVYEIREGKGPDRRTNESGDESDISLVEIGPRLVLTPIVILEGSFGGPVIYENKQYVSPNQIRSEARLHKAGKYARRRGGLEERVIKRKSLGLEPGQRRPTSISNTTLFG